MTTSIATRAVQVRAPTRAGRHQSGRAIRAAARPTNVHGFHGVGSDASRRGSQAARPVGRRACRRVACRAAGSEDVGKEVADALDGSSLFLVGMMGTGKSSVGQKLAASLGYTFFDTDTVIESVTKMSIPEIFAEEGEDGFRAIETSVLAEIASYTKCVVACGGGIVKQKMNWSHLRNGVVVCLSGPPDLLARRVIGDGIEARPLFKDTGNDVDAVAAKIEEMYQERKKMYDNADVQMKLLQADDGSEEEDLDQITNRALRVIKKRILEDDTKSRLKNEPKPGDIKITGA